MANITDYLVWRGDITLAERPFNDVDNLVLATLSYVDLTDIVPMPCNGSITLSEAIHKLLAQTGCDISGKVRGLAKVDVPFLRALADSERFGGAELSNYVDTIEEDVSLQFAALHVGLSDGRTYVAYRGTDMSITGWREDFMLSFGVTSSEETAVNYLEETTHDGTRYLVGGHSKGGVLAAYAGTVVSDEVRARIDHVYSNDGPGMTADILPKGAHEVLGEKYSHIVPHYSVIGQLFFREGTPQTIVVSSNQGMYEHDSMSWQINRDGFETCGSIDPAAQVLNRAVGQWLGEMPLDQRASFTNAMFDALEAGGATTFDDLSRGGFAGMQKVASALRQATDNEQNAASIQKLVEAFSTAWSDAATNEMNAKVTELKSSAANAMAQASTAFAKLAHAGEGISLPTIKPADTQTPPEDA